MNIREKLEQSIVWVMISIAAGAFMAGMVAMHMIYQARNREPPIEIHTPEDTKPPAEEEEPTESKPKEYGQVLTPGDPYPIGFEHIKLGMRLSALQALFPNGTMNFVMVVSYDIPIADGPFTEVLCYLDYDRKTSDGTVNEIGFHIRDEQAYEHIVGQALIALGSEEAISTYQGKCWEWTDIEGLNIKIEHSSVSIISEYNITAEK